MEKIRVGHRLEDHFVDVNEMVAIGSERSLGVGTTGRDSSVAPLSRNDTTAVVSSTPSVISTRSVISTNGRNLVPREHCYYVYLLTNKNDKVMYVGVTNHLERRVHEHKTKRIPGFTEKYNVNKLVYFEETNDVIAAIEREKEIKKWRREKKNNMVVAVNPEWKDLSDGWFKISPVASSEHLRGNRDGKSKMRDDNSAKREDTV